MSSPSSQILTASSLSSLSSSTSTREWTGLVDEGFSTLKRIASHKGWQWRREQYGVKIYNGDHTLVVADPGLDSPSRSPSSSASVRGWCLTRGDGFISASPDRVSDAVWDTTQRSVWDRLVEDIRVVRHLSSTCQLLYVSLYGQFPVSPRDLSVLMAYREEEDGTRLILLRSVRDPAVPLVPSFVRAEMGVSGWIITPSSSIAESARVNPSPAEECDVTYIVRLDPKGWLPSHIQEAMSNYQPLRISALRSILSSTASSSSPPSFASSVYTPKRDSVSVRTSSTPSVHRRLTAASGPDLSIGTDDPLSSVLFKHSHQVSMSPAQRLSLASAATASSSVNRGNVHSGDEDEDEDGDDMFCESQGDIASFMGQQDSAAVFDTIVCELQQLSQRSMVLQGCLHRLEERINEEELTRKRAIEGKRSIARMSSEVLMHLLRRIQQASKAVEEDDVQCGNSEASLNTRLDAVQKRVGEMSVQRRQLNKSYRVYWGLLLLAVTTAIVIRQFAAEGISFLWQSWRWIRRTVAGDAQAAISSPAD